MSKNAIIRWKQKVKEFTASGKPNPNFKRPMQIENVFEIGEGAHFLHVYVTPDSGPITEVDFHHDQIESVTVVQVPDELNDSPILDPQGRPVSGDEAQAEEQPPVQRTDAGATPVVPAINEARENHNDAGVV